MSLTRSESRRIASRYATAFFDLALAAKKEQQVADDLNGLVAAMGESEDLKTVIKHPHIGREEKSEAMAALLKKAGAEKQTIEFISFLAQQQRLEVLEDVAAIFAEKLAAHQDVLTAEITTARPLSAKLQKELLKTLEKAAGRSIELVTRESPSLLGGMILRVGSRMLDLSVAGKLARLQQKLKAETAAS